MPQECKRARTESLSLEEECKKYRGRSRQSTTMAASLSRSAIPSTDNNKMGPRQGALSWDDYFMSVCSCRACVSKDPNTQVGACIVNQEKRIVALATTAFHVDAEIMSCPGLEPAKVGTSWRPSILCGVEVNAILTRIAMCKDARFTWAFFLQ